MKMLQPVEVKIPAKHSTQLGSDIHAATLYNSAMALKFAIW
jgi:hypothetical protein